MSSTKCFLPTSTEKSYVSKQNVKKAELASSDPRSSTVEGSSASSSSEIALERGETADNTINGSPYPSLQSSTLTVSRRPKELSASQYPKPHLSYNLCFLPQINDSLEETLRTESSRKTTPSGNIQQTDHQASFVHPELFLKVLN
jgi:hypothetical protein